MIDFRAGHLVVMVEELLALDRREVFAVRPSAVIPRPASSTLLPARLSAHTKSVGLDTRPGPAPAEVLNVSMDHLPSATPSAWKASGSPESSQDIALMKNEAIHQA